MKPASGSRLDSWKTIAEYCKRDVRTVTRWADERRMPIHRVPGGKRGSVFAFVEEIDVWMVSQGSGAAENNHHGNGSGPSSGEIGHPAENAASAIGDKQHPQSLKSLLKWLWGSKGARFALAGAAVFVAVLIARVLRPHSGEASQLFSVKFVGDTLEARDSRGRILWTHRYGLPFDDLPRNSESPRIADYFGDGGREVATLVTLRSSPNPDDELQREIDFFGGTGSLLWRYVPDKTFRFGTHELKSPWAFLDLLVSHSDSRPTLLAAAGHRAWGNSFVAQLDPRTGHDRMRFVNTGVLYRLNELKTSSGTFLLAGGFNNEWDGGSLAIMNEDRPFAASPQTPGTRHYCDSCPPGVPDYYLVFPRSEINKVAGIYEDPIFDIRVAEGGVEVRKYERRGQAKENTVYFLTLEPHFELVSLRYDSDYDMLHKAWSAAGKLPHSLEDCPERVHPQPVRLWTPGSGWTNIRVKPAKADQ